MYINGPAEKEKKSVKLHLMQEAYTVDQYHVSPGPKRKEADSSVYTLATESEGRATEPCKIQRRKELEALQLAVEEARRSEVNLLRSAE